MSQHNRGSSYHLLQWTRMERNSFAQSLTRLINQPDVTVGVDDWWRPNGDSNRLEARTETLPDSVLSQEHKSAVRNWWLRHPRGANTPNWDFIGSVTIKGAKGLLLIEAKSHKNEASCDGKLLKFDASEKSSENHEHIQKAITEANCYLSSKHPDISISTDSHYQLANRIAYAWKFASLGIPVILIYLGFLNDMKMQDVGEPFHSESDLKKFMNGYLNDVFPAELLGKEIHCGLSSFRFFLRSINISDNGVLLNE